jgi:hypothetical protein
MRKSELAAKVANLENDLVELWSLHNKTEKLLREWVEEVEDMRGRMMRLEFVVPRQSALDAYKSEHKAMEESWRRAGEAYTYTGAARASACEPDVQKQIRDMLVEE